MRNDTYNEVRPESKALIRP